MDLRGIHVSWIVCILGLQTFVDSCGIITHLLISHRTKDNYKGVSSKYNYHKLMDRHHDAFFAGSAYPDALNERCAEGRYKDVSEDTHWAPFLNATINYIRKLPQPWDNSTEKLVTFMFGVLSHQVSDILWEGIGIEQGFISTLANINFHGSISNASQAADLGGDAVNIYLSELYFIDFLDDPEWYVPSGDLVNIYKELYGTDKIGKDVIENCTTFQLVYAVGEQLGLKELYPEVAQISPFLVDHQTDYFLGGIDDMTMWSQRLWNDAVMMLENGTDKCSIPKNTLFINCSNPQKQTDDANNKHQSYASNYKNRLTLKDFHIEQRNRGITIRPGEKLKEVLRRNKVKLETDDGLKRNMLNGKRNTYEKLPYPCSSGLGFSTFHVNSSYSKFGWSFVVNDVDDDGNDDIIIGAPKYSADDSSGQGRVYIIYGSDSGFMMCDYESININEFLNFTSFIKAPLWKTDAGFGSSVVTLDMNLDGIQDIAVGAPLTGKDFRQYSGSVYIYFGKANRRQYGDPNIIIRCESMYCNLGYTLAVSDINFDGKDDLVIGTPFYQDPQPQTGTVTALVSSSSYTGFKSFSFQDLVAKWTLTAKQAYGWFGHTIRTKYNVLMVNQPHYRLCGRQDCVVSTNDKQSAGRLHIYNIGSKVKLSNFTVTGSKEFQLAGYSSDLGFPYGDGSLILAVGFPGAAVNGTILTVPLKFSQAGIVILYNITTTGPVEIARFEGNRHYDRYGDFVKFEDVNGDNIDDLIISAPQFSSDWSGLLPYEGENGKVYIYPGGLHFQTGNVTSKDCNDAIVTPCTDKLAQSSWSDPVTDKNRFGYNVAVVKTKHQNYIGFSAPYGTEDEYGARSGMIYLHTLSY